MFFLEIHIFFFYFSSSFSLLLVVFVCVCVMRMGGHVSHLVHGGQRATSRSVLLLLAAGVELGSSGLRIKPFYSLSPELMLLIECQSEPSLYIKSSVIFQQQIFQQ